jgi:hypothetical protein
MAELEIAKHGKNIVQLAAKKEHSVAHKLREIAIEAITIVFAVSLSIWLHGWSEHRHEQQQVRSFLLGLRTDLQTDIDAVRSISASYHGYDKNFDYLAGLDPKGPADATFEEAFKTADINAWFAPRNSRFEGFRLSGKLTSIEDETLLNNILALYQEDYPAIQRSQGGWSTRQQKLRGYLDDVLEDDSSGQHYKAMTAPKGKRLLRTLIANSQIYERFDSYAARAGSIVKAIDAQYGH